jgi:WD40 repeat protein
VTVSPDGQWIAAGGWTRWTAADPQEQISIFSAVSGMLRQRIAEMHGVVTNFAFSPACDRLAAPLSGGGIRLYARDGAASWSEAATDTDYGSASYGVAFAPDRRFATTSRNGKMRVCDAEGGVLHKVTSPHAQPFGLAFIPVDRRLAVGLCDSPEVLLLDGATLAPLL